MLPFSKPARCGEPGPVRPKRCAARIEAQRSGELIWHTGLSGYVLATAPLRRASPRARYLAGEGAECHDGEPYVWTVCPFCGGDVEPPEGIAFGGGDGPE